MFLNQGSFFHFQISGDMMLARTKAYIRSGKMKISMSERLMAEEYISISLAEVGLMVFCLVFSIFFVIGLDPFYARFSVSSFLSGIRNSRREFSLIWPGTSRRAMAPM